MNIIHLILGKANPNRANGVNKVVHQLASTQAQYGSKVEVWGITSSVKHNYPERPFKTRLFKSSKNPFKVPSTLKKALKERLGRKTIIHLHGGFIPVYYPIAIFLKKHKIPYIITPHGAYNHIAMNKNKWLKKAYFKTLEKKVITGGNGVHLIGISEKNALLQFYPKLKVNLIPNGQNIPKIELKQTSHKQLNFGFCGRIDIHTKGLDLLYKAFAKFNASNPNSKLHIIGGDGEINDLKKLGNTLNIDHNIVYHGKQYGNQKLQLMSEFDFFFHPSRNEGMPGAVLEAASVNTPCIVSKESNIAEYINEHNAGIGMEHNTVEALTNAMIMGSKNSYQQNPLKMVKEHFNWEKIARAHLAVYQECLS